MVNGMVVSCCVDGIYDDLRWPIYPTSEFKRLEVKVGKVSPYIFCHHSRPSITPSDHQPLPGTLKDPSIAWSRIEICFNPSFQEVKPASRISRCPMFSADGHRTYRTNHHFTWLQPLPYCKGGHFLMQLKKAADHATNATTSSDDSWRKDVHLDPQSCLHVLSLYVCSNPAVGI